MKTTRTDASVETFLSRIKDSRRREDCLTVARLMQRATGAQPRMWGTSIVGFGDYRYKYTSGREGDWFQVGFSPRKDSLTLYIVPGVERFPQLLKKLGKHTTGVSCLYIKQLDDVDLKVLEALVKESLKTFKASTTRRKAAS